MDAEIEKRLTRIETLLETSIADVQTLLRKHDETIYGNGKKGLKERLESIEVKFWIIASITLLIVGSLIRNAL